MSTYVNLGNKKSVPISGEDGYFSIGTGLIISKDGKTVALNNYGKVGDILPVLQDASGPYVINKDGKRIDTGYAVADACLFPYPGDGPKKAKRLDGNVMNTDADNLMWVPDLDSYTQSEVMLKRVEWMGRNVTVLRTGKVMDGGMVLPVEDHYHDNTTDCERFLYKPFVKVNGLNLPVDDLMAAAGFVGGDPSGMKCPKVLHKDYDMMNFDAGNLEWAELSGADYQNYVDAVIATCRMKSDNVNAGKTVPEKWFMPPYCPKEYFNWKASGKYGGKKGGKPFV